ncbi:hypothetical protein [Mycoplasmopsis columboralis]|nr:hypothetical protein [Mycoplasmopsis columboralis]
MKQKGKKTFRTTAILSVASGALALSAIGILIALHTNYKTPRKQTYFFNELKNINNEVIEYIKQSDNKNDLVLLQQESNYASQLLENENSSIALMLQQRNKLKLELAKMKIKLATKEDLNKALDNYIALVKESDYQEIANNALETTKSQLSLSNKNREEILNSFFDTIDKLINQQNTTSLALETQIWNFHEDLVKEVSPFASFSEKSAVYQTVDQILKLLNSPSYSRDAILEYQDIFSKIVNKLSSNAIESTNVRTSFMDNLFRVKDEIEKSQISPEHKTIALQRIEEYRNIANSNETLLSVTKTSEIAYLNDLLNREINWIVDETKTEKELKKDIEGALQQINSLKLNNQIKNVVNSLVSKINDLTDQNLEQLLNKKTQLEKVIISTRILNQNISDFNTLINEEFSKNNISEDVANSFRSRLNDILNAQFDNIDDFLKEINKEYAKLTDTVVLNVTFKNALSKLNEQVSFAYQNPFDIEKNRLSEISNKIDLLIKNETNPTILNEQLNDLSNKTREILRLELRKWVTVASDSLTLENITQDTRNELTKLNDFSLPLIPEDSTATREELITLIEQYRSQINNVALDKNVNDANDEFDKQRQRIIELFGGEEAAQNSPTAQKLLQKLDQAKVDAKSAALDPNLTFEQKQAKINQLKDDMVKIADNAPKFKAVEDASKRAQEAIDKSKGNKDEQAALEKYFNKIKEAQKSAEKMLEDPRNAIGSEELAEELDANAQEYLDERIKWQARDGFDEAYEKVNNTFAPDMIGDQPTPTQQKFLDKIKEYQQRVLDKNTPEEERLQIKEDLKKIIEVVESARELEIANNSLYSLVQGTKNNDYGAFKPQQEYDKSSALNDVTFAFLDNINQNGITDKEDYLNRVKQVYAQRDALSLEIEKAFLKKTTAQLQTNLYTGDNANESPYSEINNSINDLVRRKEELLADDSATQAQISELEFEIRKQIILADKLNEAAKKLNSLDKINNSAAYENLKTAILGRPKTSQDGVIYEKVESALIDFNDTRSEISTKLKNLNNELVKTDLRIRAQDVLAQVKQLYTQEDRKHAIFDEAIIAYDKQIQNYEKLINDFGSSSNDISLVIDQMSVYLAKESQNRQDIQDRFNDAKSKLEELRTSYYQDAKNESLDATPNLDKIFSEFDRIKDLMNEDGRYPTLTQNILDLIPQISLAWYKDLYEKARKNTEVKIAEVINYNYRDRLNNDSTEENISEDIRSKHTLLLQKITEHTNSISDPENTAAIRTNIVKLTNLRLLVDQENVILNYLNTSNAAKSLDRDNVISVNNMVGALKSELKQAQSGQEDTLKNTQSSELATYRRNLYRVFLDNVSLVDAKNELIGRIEKEKTSINEQLQNNNNIDSNLLTQVNTYLDKLRDEVTKVTDKAQLPELDQKLSDWKFKRDDLVRLARKVKEGQNFYTTNNSNNLESGQITLLNKLKGYTDAITNNYLEIDPAEISNKIDEITQVINIYKEFTKVLEKWNNLKEFSADIDYPQGNSSSITPAQAKSNLDAYIDSIKAKLNASPESLIKISEVDSLIPVVKSLIALQKVRISSQKEVLAKSDYLNYQYKDNTTAEYGFTFDAKALADLILNSVPNVDTQLSQLENVLKPNLEGAFINKLELHLFREQKLNELLKSTTEKGIKTIEFELITSENSIPEKYQSLANVGNEFFHKLATQIRDATTKTQMNDAVREARLVDSVFSKYVEVADLIKIAKDKLTDLDGKSEAVKTNQNVVKSRELLQKEIDKALAYYYEERNSSILDSSIYYLDAYVYRIDLAVKVAEKTIELEAIPTEEQASANYLLEVNKAPLRAILNTPFKLLEESPFLEAKDEYQNLLQIYLEGSSNDSYRIALRNSLRLQHVSDLAKKYLDSYNTSKNGNEDYETSQMKQYYVQLQQKYDSSILELKKETHDEPAKFELISQISNGTNGLIDLLLSTKNNEIEDRYRKDLLLKKFIDSKYPIATNSPALNDYENVAVNELKGLSVSSPTDIVTANQKIKAAYNKYNDQYLAIYNWERNRYESLKDKFKPYYDFFTTYNENGLNKEILFRASAFTQQMLDKYEQIVNLNDSNAIYTKAKEAYNKKAELNNNDEQLKAWLLENAEEAISSMNLASTDLDLLFSSSIETTSVPNIFVEKAQYEKLKEQFDTNFSGQNIIKALQYINKATEIQSKIDLFVQNATQADSINNDLKTYLNERTVRYDQPLSTEKTQERTAYFEKYKNAVITLAKTRVSLNNLTYGNNATTNAEKTATTSEDSNNLRSIFDQYINGNSTFKGRGDLNNFLTYMRANELQENSDRFNSVKFEYQKVSTPAVDGWNPINQLVMGYSTSFDILIALTKGYEKLDTLAHWFENKNNTDIFYDYLGKLENGVPNYAKVSPKDTVSAEKFSEFIEGNSIPEEDLTIEGQQYKAKKLNSFFNDSANNSTLKEMFNEFNILKTSNPTYNTDNIEVFLIKEANNDAAKYTRLQLTADPSVKKVYVSYYFKFKKPAEIAQNSSSFSNVPDFGIRYENSSISFKTLNDFIIKRDNIQNNETLMRTLFTADEAGWNNLQAPVNLFGAFVKYSILDMNERPVQKNGRTTHGIPYFTENVDKDIDDDDQGADIAATQTESNSSFRVKVKLTGPYKGYTQVGNKIYWKALTPNLANDSGLQYQNTDRYRRAQLGDGDRRYFNYDSLYYYRYNAAKDRNKNFLGLPLVIAIPVTKDGRDSVLVVFWEIVNRFDKDRTNNTQNISLGNDDVFRHVLTYRNQPGKSRTSDELAKYVINKIKYRDLFALTFEGIAGGSKLWGKDPNVESDGLKEKGGVGYQDFYDAIGENGKFDIRFKLH